MTRTVQLDWQPVALTRTDDAIVAILRFHPDGTVEELQAVDLHTRSHVQIHDAPALGWVLVLGEPNPSDLRSGLDRLAGRTTAVEGA